MNTAACATNLIKAATNVGLIFASAFFPSKPAPKVINASGVAIDATLLIVLSISTGKSRRSRDAANPNAIDKMIGFFKMFTHTSF